MQYRWLVVLAVLGLPLTITRADEAAAKAVKELEGEWQVIDAESNGKKAPAEEVKSLRLVFKGDAITLTVEGRDGVERKKTFKVDPAKSPMQIDITSLDGQEKDQTAACIYSLDKRKLKLCMPYFTKDPSKRPTEFTTKEGDGLMLMVLERVKAK